MVQQHDLMFNMLFSCSFVMSKLSVYNSIEICCATCLDNFKHFVACKYKIVQKILLKINPARDAMI